MSFAIALALDIGAPVGDPVVDTGFITTGLGAGDVGYLSSNRTVTKTDATVIASTRAIGVNDGIAGDMVIAGSVDVKFTTIGGAPVAGSPVYVAGGTDEAGAAGKLTATAPTTGFLLEVGTCQDPANYVASKTARVLWKPKSLVSL